MSYKKDSYNLKFYKEIRRKKRKEAQRSGWHRYYFDVVRTAKAKGKVLTKRELPSFEYYKSNFEIPEPKFSRTIQFLANNKNIFSRKALDLPEDGVFKVPAIFSLTEAYPESFIFLKKLFYALYQDKYADIFIDYENCNRIDVDASVCMDTLLSEFIKHYKSCRARGRIKKLNQILPKNYGKESIEKILKSIGAFNTIRGVQNTYTDIHPFHLLIGNNFSRTLGKDKEIEVTKIVDYIVDSLKLMNKTLTWQAEDSLSKVVGEVIINAAEHCGNKYRYSIGYLQINKDPVEATTHVGVFNLVIFDFGRTIYENFKKTQSEELDVVKRMKELSKSYTQRNLLKSREFEEETLWTLYALQDGVTSVKAKQRGNGSIHFIESFFNLKGNTDHDNSSFLTIISGNTRIIFDGKYQIQEKPRGKEGKIYKMMTFNDSGNIEDKPDPKYVMYTENTFPGTMIVAKICINFKNIENGE